MWKRTKYFRAAIFVCDFMPFIFILWHIGIFASAHALKKNTDLCNLLYFKLILSVVTLLSMACVFVCERALYAFCLFHLFIGLLSLLGQIMHLQVCPVKLYEAMKKKEATTNDVRLANKCIGTG